MSRTHTTLCSTYLTIAALALVACWRQNLAFVIAISVTFPIFLFVRERRLHALGLVRETAPTAADLAGLAVFGIPIVLFAADTLVR